MTTYSNTREAAQALAGTHDAARAGRANKGRLATASMVGTTLEWYDFTVYNTLAALVFNHLFFPSVDPLAGTILALSTYAVGYVSRPLGGFVFGNLGDKIGRRAIRVCDLADRAMLERKLDVLLSHHNALRRGFGAPEADRDALLEMYDDLFQHIESQMA